MTTDSNLTRDESIIESTKAAITERRSEVPEPITSQLAEVSENSAADGNVECIPEGTAGTEEVPESYRLAERIHAKIIEWQEGKLRFHPTDIYLILNDHFRKTETDLLATREKLTALQTAINSTESECLPGCDKFGHLPECPVQNTALWLVSQKAEIERLRQELADERITEKCLDCGGAFSPSLVESGTCIFCLLKQARRDFEHWKANHDSQVSKKQNVSEKLTAALERERRLREVLTDINLRVTADDNFGADEIVRKIQAALATPPAMTGDAWRPISEAPEDTKVIVAFDEPFFGKMVKETAYGYFDSSRKGWMFSNDHVPGIQKPLLRATHWQPLPPPPKAAAQEGGV